MIEYSTGIALNGVLRFDTSPVVYFTVSCEETSNCYSTSFLCFLLFTASAIIVAVTDVSDFPVPRRFAKASWAIQAAVGRYCSDSDAKKAMLASYCST